MSRLFSILRRSPGLIDLALPVRAGVDGYRLKTASNFDQTFSTTILTSGVYGFSDQTLAWTPLHPIHDGYIRMTFNPLNYSLTDQAFWVQLVYLVGGIEQGPSTANPPSAPTLVLPAGAPHNGLYGFTGTAPEGADTTESLRVDLPKTVENLQVRNLGTENLYVTGFLGGPEIAVTYDSSLPSTFGGVSSLWVRGDTAPVLFTCNFTPSIAR